MRPRRGDGGGIGGSMKGLERAAFLAGLFRKLHARDFLLAHSG